MPSLHNGLTSNPKLVEAYRRALGEQSQSFSGLERASESMQPVLDLWALPEWALLRGEIMFCRAFVSAAVAARFSSTELVNPAGSGVLAVVSMIRTTLALLQVEVDAGVSIAANPLVTRGVATDSRHLAGEVSRCSITTGDTATGVVFVQEQLALSVQSSVPFIIAPGDKLNIFGAAVNTSVAGVIFWTERPLLTNEQIP